MVRQTMLVKITPPLKIREISSLEEKAATKPCEENTCFNKATYIGGRFAKMQTVDRYSKLGVKEFLPPYNGDDLELSDLLTGVAFASGGSGYDPLTSIPATATSSTGQLELFLEYKEKLKTLVGEEEATRVISEGIYFTAMGANDIANNYFSIPLRRHQYDLPSYVNFLISSAVNFTMKLNDFGAKRIGFFGIPPIGCCPSQRKHGSRECDTLQNQAAELFNSGIEKEIERLNAERNVHDSRFAYLDIYYNLLDLIKQHDFYGKQLSHRVSR
ncbi:unnamed protein product [Triticum turgidum subsp. durum]|uniref:GDSL esterase/lipase n=1 Tax=Triticum turgidum subsp. durum TaxID=4567 RepID=A0A9R1A5M9_TRITD|nr:unnamed protein product [Triticum turgidum subsp. durum]